MIQTEERTQALSPYQVQRYSRHIIMPQVGSAGQRKMLNSKVLTSARADSALPFPFLPHLAGVGTIGIVDFDTVDVTNLQRQILHQNDDIGRPKAESATKPSRHTTPMSTCKFTKSLSPPTTPSTSSLNTTSSSTARTTSPPDTSSTTPPTSAASPSWTAASCSSTGRRRPTSPDRAATAASSPPRRLRAKSQAAPRPAFSACYPAS